LKNTNFVVANFSLRENVVIFGNNQQKNSPAEAVGYRFSTISKWSDYKIKINYPTKPNHKK
jgi:hypothetical protein